MRIGEYCVRETNLTTRKETVSEPFPSESAAIEHAEQFGAEQVSKDPAVWFERVNRLGSPRYQIGRSLADGSRGDPYLELRIEGEG